MDTYTFTNEFLQLTWLIRCNDTLHWETIRSFVIVGLTIALIMDLRYGLYKTFFDKQGKPIDSHWKWFPGIGTPLLSANGIALIRMWIAVFLLPLTLAFYYDVKISSWIFNVYVILFCTDAVDGAVARALPDTTRWGMSLDPLADKVLVYSLLLLICITTKNIVFALLCGVMFLFDYRGQIIRDKNSNPAAKTIGKAKMVLQVVCIWIISWTRYKVQMDYLAIILILPCVVLAYLSYKSKKVCN